MLWLIGIAVLLVLGFVFPRFRKFIGSILGVLFLAAGLYIAYTKYENHRAAGRIKFDQVEIVAIALQGDKLKGRVRNNSPEYTLSAIRLKVTVRDVDEGGASKILGESSETIRLGVPPGRSMDFEEQVLFTGPGEPRGRFRWDYEVTGILGE